MSSTFIDESHPTRQPGYVPPRGPINVPPEVVEQVARTEERFLAQHGFRITDEARQRDLTEQTLDYYYRDLWVSYRETPAGLEVLAVGMEEIGPFLRGLSQEERLSIRTRVI